MKKETHNPIAETIAQVCTKAGFKKKADVWYCQMEEVVLLANLQKSQFGEQYYVNLAVWIKTLGSDLFPKENQCHIRCRLGSVLTEDLQKKLADVLDLGKAMDESVRKAILSDLFENYGLVWLKKQTTLSDIGKLLRNGGLEKALVQVKVREIFQQSNVPS